MQEGDGAGVENRLHRTDVDAGIGTDRPIGQHFLDRVRLGGTLDLDRIGLVDGPGGESPQVGGAGGRLVVADDGEQFGPLTQGGGISSGRLSARGERGEQLGVVDVAGLGDPTITVSAGQGGALGAARGDKDRRRHRRRVVELELVGPENSGP